MLKTFIYIIALFPSVVMAAELKVTTHKEVVLRSNIYTLGDLAEIRGSSDNQLNKIQIGKSPRPGQHIVLTEAQLKARVYRVKPTLFANIRWVIDGPIKVKAGGKALPVDKVISAADYHLKQWLLSKDYLAFDYSIVRAPDEILVPYQGNIALRPSIANGTKKASKRMSVWVDVLVNDRAYHSYRIWYQVSADQLIYVALNKLTAGTRIEKDMFTKEVLDITGINGLPAINDDDLQDKRLRTDLDPGQPLVFNRIETVPLVVEGDMVEVELNIGGINITTKGVALRNGDYKEKINVLNPTNNNSYVAVVVDKRKVRVNQL